MDQEYSVLEWSDVCDKFWKEPLVTTQAVKLLDGGGKVAIIGARQSNAPEFWGNPRCVFLRGEDAAARGLPVNTRAVVFTRFMGHTNFKSIIAEARQRNLAVFPVQGTGQLKRTLEDLLTPKSQTSQPRLVKSEPASVPAATVPSESIPAADEVPMKVAATPPPLKKGAVASWVRARYVHGMKFADMMKAVEEEGMPFGPAGVSAAFYEEKRKAKLAEPGTPLVATPEPLKLVPPPVTFPPLVKSDVVVAVDAPPPAAASSDSGSELIELIDNAIAAMQLIREQAIRVAADRARMAQVAQLLQQMGITK